MTRTREPDVLVTISDIVVKAATHKALLIVDCDGSEYWIPKSHIKPHNDADGSETTVKERGDDHRMDRQAERVGVESRRPDGGDTCTTRAIRRGSRRSS